jgi:hypothetical protein
MLPLCCHNVATFLSPGNWGAGHVLAVTRNLGRGACAGSYVAAMLRVFFRRGFGARGMSCQFAEGDLGIGEALVHNERLLNLGLSLTCAANDR